MRIAVVLLLLAACAPDTPPEEGGKPQLYAGKGRDRLCTKGDRAGFIAYGSGDTNCSVRGRLDRQGGNATLVPDGDPDCKIALTFEGDGVSIGSREAACSYYCGPAADYSGRDFAVSPSASPAVDYAGDPLC